MIVDAPDKDLKMWQPWHDSNDMVGFQRGDRI